VQDEHVVLVGGESRFSGNLFLREKTFSPADMGLTAVKLSGRNWLC